MSYWGRCLTGAVVYLVSCRTGTVVVPGQLSYLDSCLPGQLSPGQLSWGTVVAWGDVGASCDSAIGGDLGELGAIEPTM